MRKIIFHIDVNSAYLSWTAIEQLKNGAEIDIREIPAMIGGDKESRHGVVLAKSIPAKKYGIRTGEPVVNALRKCPNIHMEPPNHKLYSAYSRKMMEFLHTYTPDIEQVSVDECFLDFTGIAHQFHSPVDGAIEIKNKIKELLTKKQELALGDILEVEDKDFSVDIELQDNIKLLYNFFISVAIHFSAVTGLV